MRLQKISDGCDNFLPLSAAAATGFFSSSFSDFGAIAAVLGCSRPRCRLVGRCPSFSLSDNAVYQLLCVMK